MCSPVASSRVISHSFQQFVLFLFIVRAGFHNRKGEVINHMYTSKGKWHTWPKNCIWWENQIPLEWSWVEFFTRLWILFSGLFSWWAFCRKIKRTYLEVHVGSCYRPSLSPVVRTFAVCGDLLCSGESDFPHVHGGEPRQTSYHFGVCLSTVCVNGRN